MNLYYIQPMLVHIANDFGTTNEAVSRIPTLVQAGYGCGIVLITPLGDLVRRRQLVLLLFTLTCTLSIALATARSVVVLEGLSFVVGMFSVSLRGCAGFHELIICIGAAPDLYTLDGRSCSFEQESDGHVDHVERLDIRSRRRQSVWGYYLEFCIVAGYLLVGSGAAGW